MNKKILLSIVIVLGLVIVGIMLYLVLIRISDSPKDAAQIAQPEENSKINQDFPNIQKVTLPDENNTFIGGKDKGGILDIPNSKIKVMGALKINISIKIESKSSTMSAGYLFSNSLPRKDEKTFNASPSLYLFYYPPGNSWVIRTVIDGEKKYYPILTNKDSLSGNYSLYVSSNGKEIIIANKGAYRKTIQLKSSLYSITNNMASYVFVSPGNEVNLHELTYQY